MSRLSRFWGVFRYEHSMAIRRPGLWIAYGLLFVFYTIALLRPPAAGEPRVLAAAQVWQFAGQMAFTLNLFLPVAAGILAADRLQRDSQLGVRELQASTPLGLPAYLLGKYAGVLAAFLWPVLAWIWLVSGYLAASGEAPLGLVYTLTLAFFVMVVPALAFVVAFSLACPLVMPMRVYQILFTGYWYWANYIPPSMLPTLNGTLLTPGGMYAFQGFFGGFPGVSLRYTAADAALNLLVLGLSIVLVFVVLAGYLRWQARRA